MHLVLLSGGSGTRLWPLSNNARSKQFLPLLEKEDGTMESMVQRIVRQIQSSPLSAPITVATNTSQADGIINQLGDIVSVVTEPERRGTFPAVALAAAHLHLIQACPRDEIVVIMPCDPYTEASYFDAIGQMIECAEQGVAELVFMGIQPTHPTDKYGYVLPAPAPVGAPYRLMSRFVEKPRIEVAQQLLTQGAYWNGGVFAFRLGYMLDIISRYIDPSALSATPEEQFRYIRSHYSSLPRTSFDCEVAEKAHSAAFVPFKGEWLDLGSWNVLTSHLHQPVMGNAFMGPHCEGTHVINELQHPIYVDGLKDVVVAACPDGILVCAKQYTEDLKTVLGDPSNSSLSSSTSSFPLIHRPMYEERRWGTYRVLDDSYYADGRHSLTKSITLRPGKNISYQIHHHRSETWTFVQGEGIFVLDGQRQHVKAGDTVVIPLEHWHAIRALTELTFIEVQSGNPLIEEDIERTTYDWSL